MRTFQTASLVAALLLVAVRTSLAFDYASVPELRWITDGMNALKEELLAVILRQSEVIDELQGRLHNSETQWRQQLQALTEQVKKLEAAAVGGNGGRAAARNCEELIRADPSVESGEHWIDPDGPGPEAPVRVHCNTFTGTTSVLHDGPHSTDVGHCRKPGCFSKAIEYQASMKQILALIEHSTRCQQEIQYECTNAPLEFNGEAQSWWNDRNGRPRYFWSGNYSETHLCQCGIDGSCVDPDLRCNCDAVSGQKEVDSGAVTNKMLLPVTALNFGRTWSKASSGRYTLGPLECSGSVASAPAGIPESCGQLQRIGHHLPALYQIRRNGATGTVYCDLTRQPGDQGFETPIESTDSTVYFEVSGFANGPEELDPSGGQRRTDKNNAPELFTLTVDFETGAFVRRPVAAASNRTVAFAREGANVGGAIDAASGLFTAPAAGLYRFTVAASFPCCVRPVFHLRKYHEDSWRPIDWFRSTAKDSVADSALVDLAAGDRVTLHVDGQSLRHLVDESLTLTGMLLYRVPV